MTKQRQTSSRKPTTQWGASAANPLVPSLLTLINAERDKRVASSIGYRTPVFINRMDGTAQRSVPSVAPMCCQRKTLNFREGGSNTVNLYHP
jgi:hypothetical protein